MKDKNEEGGAFCLLFIIIIVGYFMHQFSKIPDLISQYISTCGGG